MAAGTCYKPRRVVFTGLIEDVGVIAELVSMNESVQLTIAPQVLSPTELGLGESIAVDGVCLTVEATRPASFQVTAGAETLARTTVKNLQRGDRVNLERALRLSDRLGGHLVQGHVDCVGTITHKAEGAGNVVMDFECAPALIIVEKGSITVDGISLTVNRAEKGGFSVALIPHTLDHTTLGKKRVGDTVNLEADMIGKYVEKLLAPYRP